MDQPSNNSAGTLRSQSFGWSANHIIYNASSPIYTASSGTNGGYIGFALSSGRVTQVSYHAVANPTIPDGTNSGVLQAGVATGMQQYKTVTYSTNLSTAETSVTDTDGHKIDYFWDTVGRVKYVHAWSSTTAFLTNYEVWDSRNNLTATLDPRSSSLTDTTYRTDYAYDRNGNAIAVAKPSASTGAYRPTALYSYDSFNNVTAYCDPVWSHNNGKDWTLPPASSDSLCPSQSGTTRYTWQALSTLGEPTSPEPYGELVSSQTPLGYQSTFAYTPSSQGGDFGLPTSVTGTTFAQIDGSSLTPLQTLTYDSYGNLTTYDKGNGAWSLAYAANRNLLASATDPDGVTTRRCYYANNQLQQTQSAAQYALDNGIACGSNAVSYAYDIDGDVTSETHHYNGVAGTTQKFYDGMDRLVEVVQPHGSGDYFPFAWITRYIYDLSKNGSALTIGPVSGLSAHGNLLKTQECLPSNPVVQVSGPPPTSCVHQDVRGSTFDALDRVSAKYEVAFGTAPQFANTYDAPGNAGLLSVSQNALGEQVRPGYDDIGRIVSMSFANDGGRTPNRTYAFDANGRTVSITSAQFGTLTHTYDADGRLTQMNEPTGGGYTASGVVTHSYYADGKEKQVGLSVASIGYAAPALEAYSYRRDGELQTETAASSGASGSFRWTYTNAGRELTQSDPATDSVITTNPFDSDNNQNVPYPLPAQVTLVKKQYAYDVYGRISALTLPRGASYTAFTYDPEGETSGYNAYAIGPYTPQAHLGYTVRGELISMSFPTMPTTCSKSATYCASYPSFTHVSANGFICQTSACTYDSRSNMLLTAPAGVSEAYSYDAGGRQTTTTASYTVYVNGQGYPQQGSMNRGYDAENHLVSQSFAVNYAPPTSGCAGATISQTTTARTVTYAWGPTGHPILPASTSSDYPNESVHWNGDSILYTYAGGQVNVFLGKLATIHSANSSSAAFTEIDRDWSGNIVDQHSTKNFGHWEPTSPVHNAMFCHTLIAPWASDMSVDVDTDPVAGEFKQVGTDGYNDAYNTFQGTRVYDPTMAQWTSPDPYAGDVHDPMSQKPFMWNRNNPVQYGDPSGFCPWCEPFIEEWEQVEPELQPAEAEGMAALRASQATISQAASRAGDWLKQAGASVNNELQAATTRLFKGGQQEVPGGTAGAIRTELLKGGPVGGRFHLQKGAEEINIIKDLISSGKLTAQEMQKAKTILQDLKNAFGKLDPQQFINNNNLPTRGEMI